MTWRYRLKEYYNLLRFFITGKWPCELCGDLRFFPRVRYTGPWNEPLCQKCFEK